MHSCVTMAHDDATKHHILVELLTFPAQLLGGLHTANLSWQTHVGKLKLVYVNGTKTVSKHVGKLLATNRTCLYSRQLFHQLFHVGKLVFDM